LETITSIAQIGEMSMVAARYFTILLAVAPAVPPVTDGRGSKPAKTGLFACLSRQPHAPQDPCRGAKVKNKIH
jgi:hypothetical protein